MHEDLDGAGEPLLRQFAHQRPEVERPAARHLEELNLLRQLLLRALAVLLRVNELHPRAQVAGERGDEVSILREMMRGEGDAHTVARHGIGEPADAVRRPQERVRVVLDGDHAPDLLGRGDARPQVLQKILDGGGEFVARHIPLAGRHRDEHRRLGSEPLRKGELTRQLEGPDRVAGDAAEFHAGHRQHLPHLLLSERVDLLPLRAVRLRPEVDHHRPGLRHLGQDVGEGKVSVQCRGEDVRGTPRGVGGSPAPCDRRGRHRAGGRSQERASRNPLAVRHDATASACG